MMKPIRLTRKEAGARFSALALKRGWRVARSTIDLLLSVRATDADGNRLPQLLFFTSMALEPRPGRSRSVVVIDHGNFDKECEIACKNQSVLHVSKKQEIDLANVNAPTFGKEEEDE
jgi:hypothetical protein